MRASLSLGAKSNNNNNNNSNNSNNNINNINNINKKERTRCKRGQVRENAGP